MVWGETAPAFSVGYDKPLSRADSGGHRRIPASRRRHPLAWPSRLRSGRRARPTRLQDDRRAAAACALDVDAVAADVDLLPGRRSGGGSGVGSGSGVGFGIPFTDSQSLPTRSFASAFAVSRPRPQESLSLPGPPVRRSLPGPPTSRSFPASPNSLSLPPFPYRLSARAVPRSVSFPPVPGTTAAHIVPANARTEIPAVTAIKCDFVNCTVTPNPLPWPAGGFRKAGTVALRAHAIAAVGGALDAFELSDDDESMQVGDALRGGPGGAPLGALQILGFTYGALAPVPAPGLALPNPPRDIVRQNAPNHYSTSASERRVFAELSVDRAHRAGNGTRKARRSRPSVPPGAPRSSAARGLVAVRRYLAMVWRPTSAAIGSFLLITVLLLADMIFVSKAICTTMVANAFDMNVSTSGSLLDRLSHQRNGLSTHPPSKLGTLPSKLPSEAAEEVDFARVLQQSCPVSRPLAGIPTRLKLNASVPSARTARG